MAKSLVRRDSSDRGVEREGATVGRMGVRLGPGAKATWARCGCGLGLVRVRPGPSAARGGARPWPRVGNRSSSRPGSGHGLGRGRSLGQRGEGQDGVDKLQRLNAGRVGANKPRTMQGKQGRRRQAAVAQSRLGRHIAVLGGTDGTRQHRACRDGVGQSTMAQGRSG